MSQLLQQRSSRRQGRLGFLAVFLTVLALIMSACGAKVETNLGLENSEKGSRTITVSFSLKDNKDYLKGDVNALDASIKKHKPQELDYEGIRTEGDNAQATFKVNFNSVDEYRTKVSAILRASSFDKEPQILISNSKDGLVQGVEVSENFTSQDLIKWLPEALVTDGLVEAKRKDNVLQSSGKNSVTFEGREIKTTESSSEVQAKDLKDNGFDEIVIAVDKKDGKYNAKIVFLAKEIMVPDRVSAVDTYLNSVKPEGAELTKGIDEEIAKKSYRSLPSTQSGKDESGRNLKFTADSFEDLNAKLQKILGTQETALESSQEVKTDSSGAKIIEHITGSVDCSRVCSPGTNYGVKFSFSDDGKNFDQDYGSSNSSSSSASASDRVIKVNLKNSRTIQPESLNVNSALGMDGSVEAKFELAFKSSDVAQAGDALKSFVQGSDEAQATFEERTDGDNTIYSAKIRGKDSAEFNTRIGNYLPGSEMTIHHPGGVNLFGADYTVSPKFNLQERFGQLQPKNYDFKFELPIMSSVKTDALQGSNSMFGHQDSHLSGDGRNVTVNSSEGYINTSSLTIPAHGFTMTDFVVDAILLGLLLLILLVLFIFRKRIRRASQKARERRAAQQAVQPTAAYTASDSDVLNYGDDSPTVAFSSGSSYAAETDGTIPLPAQQAPIPKHAAKSQQKPISGDSDQDFLQ